MVRWLHTVHKGLRGPPVGYNVHVLIFLTVSSCFIIVLWCLLLQSPTVILVVLWQVLYPGAGNTAEDAGTLPADHVDAAAHGGRCVCHSTPQSSAQQQSAIVSQRKYEPRLWTVRNYKHEHRNGNNRDNIINDDGGDSDDNMMMYFILECVQSTMMVLECMHNYNWLRHIESIKKITKMHGVWYCIKDLVMWK